METLIAPTQAAATSGRQTVNVPPGKREVPHIEQTLFAPGLAGAETVSIQLAPTESVAANMFVGGAQAQLTADNNVYTIRGQLPIRVVKSTTAAEVGVYLSD